MKRRNLDRKRGMYHAIIEPQFKFQESVAPINYGQMQLHSRRRADRTCEVEEHGATVAAVVTPSLFVHGVDDTRKSKLPKQQSIKRSSDGSAELGTSRLTALVILKRISGDRTRRTARFETDADGIVGLQESSRETPRRTSGNYRLSACPWTAWYLRKPGAIEVTNRSGWPQTWN